MISFIGPFACIALSHFNYRKLVAPMGILTIGSTVKFVHNGYLARKYSDARHDYNNIHHKLYLMSNHLDFSDFSNNKSLHETEFQNIINEMNNLPSLTINAKLQEKINQILGTKEYFFI